EKHAVEAYQRIVSRYPAMHRAGDARRRLEALHADVPTPTAEALAESKAEEHSRHSLSRTQQVMHQFQKHPTVARASGAGDPNMEEEKGTSAPALVQDMNKRVTEGVLQNQKLGLKTVKAGTGTPEDNQPPPTSGTNNNSDTTNTAANTGASSNGNASNGSGS